MQQVTDRSSATTTHVVKHFGPALEGDALEDGQHGQAEVVEIRDAPIRPLPKLLAAIIVGSHVVALVAARSARNWIVHDRICENFHDWKIWKNFFFFFFINGDGDFDLYY